MLHSELSLKLYWRGKYNGIFFFKRRRPKEIRFLNRRDWEPIFSLYICTKHFEEKYYKKGKNSKRYRLAMNMKPVRTIFDPKKAINNNNFSEITEETFISRRSI